MKSRLYFFLIIAIFVGISLVFIMFLWQENTKTRLTVAERNLLSNLENILLNGDSHFPPLSYTDHEGQYNGYEADLVKALELWLDIPIEYHQISWNEAVKALANGQITGITGMRITEERSNTYHFSKPYWQTSYCLVNYIGRNHELILGGRRPRATMQKGSATHDFFMEHFYKDQMEVNLVENAEEGFYYLSKGYTDIWFENYQVARYEALRANMLEYFSFHVIPESSGNYAIALGPDHALLVPIINKALLALEADGTLSELDQKWFGLTDYREKASPWHITLPAGLYVIFTVFIMILLWNRSLQSKVEQKTEELSKSEEKFRASFEGSHDAIIIANNDGSIIDCNQNAIALFGFTCKNSFLRAGQDELSPVLQPDGNDSGSLYRKKIGTVLRYNTLLKFEWLHKRHDNSTFLAEVALTAYPLGGQTVIQANISDITERKRIQDQLQFLSLHDQLTGLYNRTFFEAELLRISKGRFFPLTLISCDLDGLKLINDTMGHETGDRLLITCANILQNSLRASDILARVGGDEFCAILPHTSHDEAEDIARRIRQAIKKYNQKNKDLPLGLSIGLATADSVNTKLRDLFSQADDMMYRDKLYRSGSLRNKVVESLLAALAEKDYITEGHAQRLETLCILVGEKINLSTRQLTDLALLTKVHDLGKVGIPDQILNKPGPLDEEEWVIMKQHSEKGFRIATSSPDLSGIADLILKHHERWDGSGYPLGLSGEDIPVECRILAIVDAYDAMTHDRPYSRAKSREEALTEIKNAAGYQFDPNLALVFIDIITNGNTTP